MNIFFDESDKQIIVSAMADGYIQSQLSAEQFAIFEQYCSGSSLSGGWDKVLQWASERLASLQKEAQENWEGFGVYGLPMGYCPFVVTDEVAVYETTSGTILATNPEGEYMVRIPQGREGGFHHGVLQNLLDGWSADQIDRRINPHLYVQKEKRQRVATPTDDVDYELYEVEDCA